LRDRQLVMQARTLDMKRKALLTNRAANSKPIQLAANARGRAVKVHE
jgi:hypothetical protein